MGRQIVHHYSRDAPNIYAHLHSRGAVEYVDITLLKQINIVIESLRRLLSRMFCGSIVKSAFYGTVANIGPEILGPKVLDDRIL